MVYDGVTLKALLARVLLSNSLLDAAGIYNEVSSSGNPEIGGHHCLRHGLSVALWICERQDSEDHQLGKKKYSSLEANCH